MSASVELISRELLEVVPPIMRTIKHKWKEGPISGVSNTQFRILMFIKKHPGAALQDVARHLGLTSPTTSTTVDELVNNQLVSRAPSTEDRRKITLTLTDQGKQTLEEVFEYSRQHLAGYLSPLSSEESEIVYQALKLLGLLFSSQQKESREKL
jgi:DNA-binding MarR family transcriptional regulator